MNVTQDDQDSYDGRSYLYDLPDELLLHVLTLLQDTRTRASLCLVSRRLNRIVTPLLYERYDTESHDFPSLFMRTLAHRSDLAQHVKFLDWCYIAHRLEFDAISTEAANVLDGYNLSFATVAALAARGLRRYDERSDALFTAALMQVPNIVQIRLVDEFRDPDNQRQRRWLEPIRIRVPHTFRCLQSADISMASMGINDIACLMKVPTLQRLRLERINVQEGHAWPLIPVTSKIKDLTLESCRMHHRNVVSIITTCKLLTSFFYIKCDAMHNEDMDDVHNFKATLDRYSETLQTLDLDVTFRFKNNAPALVADLGSFSHYTNLKELCINVGHLLSYPMDKLMHRLPITLRTLRLTNCVVLFLKYRDFEWLETASQTIGSSVWQLKRVYMCLHATSYISCRGWENIQRICASHGLELRVWELRHMDKDEWNDPYHLASAGTGIGATGGVSA